MAGQPSAQGATAAIQKTGEAGAGSAVKSAETSAPALQVEPSTPVPTRDEARDDDELQLEEEEERQEQPVAASAAKKPASVETVEEDDDGDSSSDEEDEGGDRCKPQ